MTFLMRPLLCAVLLVLGLAGAVAYASSAGSLLPNGWLIFPPDGAMTQTDTMPQGAAASPDGASLAVVESGFNPPTLRFYDTASLEQTASVPLAGAFGRPLWIDAGHVLVAGANADALLVVDVAAQRVRAVAMPKHSYPTAVARFGDTFAVATDGDGSVRAGALDALAAAQAVHVGTHVGGLAFSTDGQTLFASNRAGSDVVAVDVASLAARRIATGLHPSDLLAVGSSLYVAESDADRVGVYDARGGALARIFVGDREGAGSSPNALATDGKTIFVSLGAANAVAEIRNGAVAGRLAAGWYPTDVVPLRGKLYVVDGKGEGTRPNPYFDAKHRRLNDYVAAIQYGSIRVVDLARDRAGAGNPQGAIGWESAGGNAIVRSGGPIRHVFFILKENRSYDQVLGDVAEGNGDPKITWFGARVTPNEHAIAARFGLFDNTYASGEVSESGHNWADAAFVNDYVERAWPSTYGDRGNVDDSLSGEGAAVPANGYIWQAARAAGVSFRDYGELTDTPNLTGSGTSFAPSLKGVYDPHYVGWNLDYSDLDRLREWRREFAAFVARGDLPQLEYIWLPNDHTYGSRVGKLTPVSYVATNDYALGQMIDTISHSPVWRSSAIFVIEDDAQAGPDHVSDQRTTFFLASPYARGGLQHAHYATVGVLRTMELILGLKPLSTYDAMAVPLYAAFSTSPDLRPYNAIAPQVSLTARTRPSAYGTKVSATMDFSRPDAVEPALLTRVIAHNVER